MSDNDYSDSSASDEEAQQQRHQQLSSTIHSILKIGMKACFTI